jgi:hypothetical protein
LAGGLLANAIRVRLVRLAAGRGRLPSAASSLQHIYNKKRTKFIKRVRPSRLQHSKLPLRGGMPSLSRLKLREALTKRQILVRAKFAFLPTKIKTKI